MKHALRFSILFLPGLCVLLLAGCAGPTTGIQNVRARDTAAASIASEPPGDYWIGRRYYKKQYKIWGYVRRPGQPWKTAQLVMMNEHQKLAPDRAANKLGSDNNHEYRLFGGFSGDTVYEPASNGIYPEFVLKDYQLISANPPPIFPSQIGGRASNPLAIERPQ